MYTVALSPPRAPPPLPRPLVAPKSHQMCPCRDRFREVVPGRTPANPGLILSGMAQFGSRTTSTGPSMSGRRRPPKPTLGPRPWCAHVLRLCEYKLG
ncbi:hypothetical protein EJ04DRAFT_125047 [Polyplosphaeria fusca]|uniref:Uncharacterized protein n=1 Tax=Polyplosphaeria fusca TaxID=682080 RepID=A0A9P4R5X4_9PLEO|nr:hypothetical protein EJ04DRAFT_125047 [Polyplosphaeria fusca]